MTDAPRGVPAAEVVGPGNIGTDLLAKLRRSDCVEVAYMVGVVGVGGFAASPRARGGDLRRQGRLVAAPKIPLPELVFEATSASAHAANTPPRYAEADVQSINLAPAHIGR